MWNDHYTLDDIYEQLDLDRTSPTQTIIFNIHRPPKKNKFLIPMFPIVQEISFKIELYKGNDRVLLSARYNQEPNSYKSSLEEGEFTHRAARSTDFKSFNDLENEIITYYFDQWSVSYSLFSFVGSRGLLTNTSNGYLYVDVFGGLSRVANLNMRLVINVKEFLECYKNPTQTPASKTCQRMISLPPGTHTIQVSGKTKTFTVQQNQITDISINNKIIQIQDQAPDPTVPDDDYIALNSIEEICQGISKRTLGPIKSGSDIIGFTAWNGNPNHGMFGTYDPSPISSKVKVYIPKTSTEISCTIASVRPKRLSIKFNSPPIDNVNITPLFSISFNELIMNEYLLDIGTGIHGPFDIINIPNSFQGGWLYFNITEGYSSIEQLKITTRYNHKELCKTIGGEF